MRTERIHDGFIKHHLEGFPFQAAIHEFHGPEGGYPHDHPWNFTSIILSGWYREKVYSRTKGGIWCVEEYEWGVGDDVSHSHLDVHSIIETAPEGCFTFCQYGDGMQEPSFYKFVNGRLLGKRPAETRHELDSL